MFDRFFFFFLFDGQNKFKSVANVERFRYVFNQSPGRVQRSDFCTGDNDLSKKKNKIMIIKIKVNKAV